MMDLISQLPSGAMTMYMAPVSYLVTIQLPNLENRVRKTHVAGQKPHLYSCLCCLPLEIHSYGSGTYLI